MTQEQWKNKDQRGKILKRLNRKAERELKGLDQPKSPLIQAIGKQLAEKRMGRNLTTKALEALSGIGHGHINKIEHGLLNVSISSLEKLAEAMGHNLKVEIVRKKLSDSELEQ